MESIQSKLLKVALRFLRLNKMWKLTGDELRKYIEKKQLSESYELPKEFQGRYDICKKEMKGYCYYVIKPLKGDSKKHILYIHGGGFVYEITSLHWVFLGKLIDALGCTITIPIYPLAPIHKFQEVFDMIVPIYEQIILNSKVEDIVIMGDS
jgi:acetyl esterase/lipase